MPRDDQNCEIALSRGALQVYGTAYLLKIIHGLDARSDAMLRRVSVHTPRDRLGGAALRSIQHNGRWGGHGDGSRWPPFCAQRSLLELVTWVTHELFHASSSQPNNVLVVQEDDGFIRS